MTFTIKMILSALMLLQVTLTILTWGRGDNNDGPVWGILAILTLVGYTAFVWGQ